MRFIAPITMMFAAATIACSDSTDPTINTAAGRWEDAGFSNYTFTAERSCFCTEEGRGPVRISVVNGEVASVVMISSEVAVDPEIWFTIEDLFEMVREQMRTLPDRVDVEYDETLGYPKRFTYGTPENDGGGIITVRDVVKTSG